MMLLTFLSYHQLPRMDQSHQSWKFMVRLEPLQQSSRRAVQEYLCRKLNSKNAMIPGGRYLSVEVGSPE
jgi:hypothetical protein